MKGLYGSTETGTTIYLIRNLITGVQVHKDFRGRGHARYWMEQVCKDADAEGLTLMLGIDPFEPSISVARLRAFYESLGFVVMGEDPDRRAMIRPPKKGD